jgi:hypothetical protein
MAFFTTVTDTFASHDQLVAIRQELDIARKMQEAILPRAFERHPRVDLRASMTPALEVAGDFYDSSGSTTRTSAWSWPTSRTRASAPRCSWRCRGHCFARSPPAPPHRRRR